MQLPNANFIFYYVFIVALSFFKFIYHELTCHAHFDFDGVQNHTS